MDTMTKDTVITDTAVPEVSEKGYRLKIGRDVIRVVSVFSGTRTASEVIHEAAVKKILFEKAAG